VVRPKPELDIKQGGEYRPSYRSIGFNQPRDDGTYDTGYERLREMLNQRHHDIAREIAPVDVQAPKRRR
jgi:hypothetical protein